MTEYVKAYIATCEGYGWEGGPQFSTRIITKANGRERRNADWSQPMYGFNLPFNNIKQPQYVPVLEMFLNRVGAWGVFLFRNPLDYVADDEVFATAEAGQTEFQLGKWAIKDGATFFRHVYALYEPDPTDPGDAVESIVTVTADDSPISVLVDHERGKIITDPMTGGEILRWSGGFSHWVRFQNDSLPFTIDNRSGEDYVVNGSIGLHELPPPEASDSSGS